MLAIIDNLAYGFCEMKVYLANIAEPHFPRRGISVFAAMGHEVSGNLLAYNRETLEQASADLIIYVPLVDPRNASDGAVFLSERTVAGTLTVLWILYPDEIVGWDTTKNCFGGNIAEPVRQLLPHVRVTMSNSRYTKWLLDSCATPYTFDICYPGIDTRGIKQRTSPARREDGPMKVLWHHRWSIDKNFQGAMEIVLRLAVKYPEILFYIGRKGDDTSDWYQNQALAERF